MHARKPLGRLHLAAFSLLTLAACTVPVLAAAPAAAFADASAADKAFVAKVSQGGMYEVEASQVAATRAQAPDVKDLALTEVHDHTGVGSNLKKLCTGSGIPVSATLNPEFSARLAKLKSASPSGFDAAYIADMQSIHDKDEKLFAQEANDGSASFQPFAHQTDLIVKRHIGALHGLDK